MTGFFDLYRVLDLRLGAAVSHKQIVVTKAQTTDDLIIRFEASTTSNPDSPARTFVEEISEKQMRDEPDMAALATRMADKILADLGSNKTEEQQTMNLVDHPNKKRALPDGKPLSKAEWDELEKTNKEKNAGTIREQKNDPEAINQEQQSYERAKTPLGNPAPRIAPPKSQVEAVEDPGDQSNVGTIPNAGRRVEDRKMQV